MREEFEQISVQTYEDWSKVEAWFKKAKPTIQNEWSNYFGEFLNLISKSRFWSYEYANYKAITIQELQNNDLKLQQAPERDAEEAKKAKQEILDLFEGLLRLETNNSTSESEQSDNSIKLSSNKVFIVHGHDDLAKEKVARFLEKIELKAIILHEQSSGGRKIIEKLEYYTLVTVHTIGHGRHAWTDFLALLQKNEIAFLCDVRSVARSRWVQFNGAVLLGNLRDNGIGYEHLPECGGKTIAKPKDLESGIERILEISTEVKTAIMCSESQPLTKHKIPRANCHRVGLLSPLLKSKGVVRIVHILPNGDSIEFDESAVASIW